jgi:hypothetical protein
MRLRHVLITTAAMVLPLCAGTAAAAAAAERSAHVEIHDALREALVADPAEDAARVEADARRMREELLSIADRLGPGRPTYHRAQRLHRLLHRRYLLHYREEADGLRQLLARGDYNCLSATVFYGLAARELGYDVRVLELPGHLLLELAIGDAWVRVETTSLRGFDREGNVAVMPSSDGGGGTAYLLLPGHDRSAGSDGYRRVSLEEAVGFMWLNAAWRSFDRGDSVGAADSAAEALRFLSDEPMDGDVQRVLARAFRAEYEGGRFEEAYRIAVIELLEFPAETTPRDRLFAAGIKRVEDACDDGDPSAAAAIAEHVASLSGPTRETGRFERRAWPLVASAAVRLEDWDLARCAVTHYERVEPDPLEARRLAEWVTERREQAAQGTIVAPCPG